MEWFEHDDFWELTYPFMFPETRNEKAEEDVLSVLSLSRIETGDVLDLCCGPGRFSIPLARMGYSVTGVDTTGFLLDIARNRASLENVEVEWVEEDMRGFLRPGSYDLVLNMFTSFGYFQNHSDNMKVLANVNESLRQGGKFVMEIMGKETLASIFHPVTDVETDEGLLLIQRHKIEDGWNRIENDWLLIDNDRVLGRWKFSHWVYSATELRNMLRDAGFSNVEVYGNLEGTPYNSDSGRLIVVATAD
ncbi:MAG: methyltransferase domain-containing protein [Candidatus Aegiribacteria sp.]|nr:methyltransferase domain-containing protein [Candidatus Aegiribacteria sp.]